MLPVWFVCLFVRGEERREEREERREERKEREARREERREKREERREKREERREKREERREKREERREKRREKQTLFKCRSGSLCQHLPLLFDRRGGLLLCFFPDLTFASN